MVALTSAALSAKFPSLAKYLPPSSPIPPLLGLYFAASWCPDCAPVTPKMRQVLVSQKTDLESPLVQLLYVPSDQSAAQMNDYVGDSFPCFPFDKVEELAELKRHFGTCAAKEMHTLGITSSQRRHGIPTLILLESATGRVLTEDGINDVFQNENVIEKWESML